MKIYDIVGILTGFITSSIGGLVKNIILFNTSSKSALFGVVLLPSTCWLVPLIGGFIGWVGPFIARKVLSAKSEIPSPKQGTIEQFPKRKHEQLRLTIIGFVSGLLGGLITTIIFLPILLYD